MRIGGFLLVGIGLALLVLNVINMTRGGPRPGDPDFMGQAEADSRSFMLLGILSVACIMAGATLLRFGFMRSVSSIVATETAPAVEYSSAALGRGIGSGLRESGFAGGVGPAAVVRLKCRSCGFLESEDARFCSQCSKAM